MSEPPWVKCNRLMYNFEYEQRRRSWIWAAKNQTCSFCGQPPNKPCINMTDFKRHEQGKLSQDQIRNTLWPHTQRVDWHMLYKELLKRGYRPKVKETK